MDKPQKPIDLLPESFGGQKENFSEDKIATGYQPDVPDILGGANLNYMLDAAGKNFKYNNAISDFVNGLPINNIITTDVNNKLIYKDITDFLEEKHFLNKTQITNCILEAPNGVADFSGTTITVKSGLKYLTGSGRNADRTLKNTENTLNDDKTINFLGISNSTDAVLYIYNNMAGYCPLSEVYRTSTKPAGNAASNQVWLDAVNNKIYYSAYQSADWVETTDFIIAAKLNVTDSVINSLVEEYPVELVKKTDLINLIHRIGDPIITLSNTLEDNEIWLEGGTVSRTTYAELFAIYGTTYGAGDGSTTFVLPDFRNRAIWGANSFGYIEAGLPNITGKVSRFFVLNNQPSEGALSGTDLGLSSVGGRENSSFMQINLDASKSNSIYSNEVKTVQPPSIKVRVKTRYK